MDQAWLDAVKWNSDGLVPAIAQEADGGTVLAERGISSDVMQELERRGHQLRTTRTNGGGYQAILIDPRTNMLQGGSEPRKDGCAAGY